MLHFYNFQGVYVTRTIFLKINNFELMPTSRSIKIQKKLALFSKNPFLIDQMKASVHTEELL